MAEPVTNKTSRIRSFFRNIREKIGRRGGQPEQAPAKDNNLLAGLEQLPELGLEQFPELLDLEQSPELEEPEQAVETVSAILTKINLLTDLAIGEIEDGRKDGLGFETYAQVLGDAAAGTSGPFVIGIFGEWGTGKTSLMKMIDTYLGKTYQDTVRVWVNAWKFEREKHPIIPLIATIINELEKSKNLSKRAQDAASSLLTSLRALLYGLSFKVKVGGPGAEVEGAFSPKDAVEREKELTKSKLDRSLYYDAFEVLSDVNLKGIRIIIIIDDLDRCLPDMAINLLESIKLVFAQKGFIFIFGAARTIIEGYLQHRYEIKFGLKAFASRSYLDKIVQLPFYIPPHGGRIDRFLQSILESTENEKITAENVRSIIQIASAGNPRTTIRFINNLIIDHAIYTALADQETGMEEIPIVFFAITRSLEQRWGAKYDLLVKSAQIRKWLVTLEKDQLGSGTIEAPRDQNSSDMLLQLEADNDFRDLLFSEWGREWLNNDTLRQSTIEFLLTQRPNNDVDLPPDETLITAVNVREPHIAHPYTLLQTSKLVGRQAELNLLTDWVSEPGSEVYKDPVLSIVAIGGVGKSALTWKWFNEIAPAQMDPLAGRVWWSFYDSDATFENFLIRTLAYMSNRPIEEIQSMSVSEREFQMLNLLDTEPFLIVMDGVERILIAYALMDIGNYSGPEQQRKLRKTADPRAGIFLKKLLRVKTSRILCSSRLPLADFETDGGDPVPGNYNYDLKGLSNEDALALWRVFGVSGSREVMLPIFEKIGNHPLLIQALAGEVKRFKKAPGDFEKWREANPEFDPAKFSDLKDRMVHVIELALRGLSNQTQKVLQTISAFRIAVPYDTLTAVFLGADKLFVNQNELDEALLELEDRGLVGWDKLANRYDLHPIVRGVVWNGVGDSTKHGVYTNLYQYFEKVPMIESPQEVETLEDLTPAIELYNTLIGLKRYDNAGKVFLERLNEAMFFRLSANRQAIEVLELLFPDGLAQLPRLRENRDQVRILNALATAHKFIGQPKYAHSFYRRAAEIGIDDHEDSALLPANLSDVMRATGSVRESERAALRALIHSRKLPDRYMEAISWCRLGITRATRGIVDGPEIRKALQISETEANKQLEGELNSVMAQQLLWFGQSAVALPHADKAWELAQIERYERDIIRAVAQRGCAALELDDFAVADERLHHALVRARAVNLAEEELPVLIALAELRRRQGEGKAAREFLDDVWEFAERGPYPLFHADALNVLAQIERGAGNTEKAIEAATKAYELSWCDGPPYAYHWGLIKAQKHLEELGAPLPDMPPFDESKFEPMPEVEFDSEDESS